MGNPERTSAGPARGILHKGAPGDSNGHQRILPGRALQPFVAHFWTVRWSLAAPRMVATLPHPSVHIVFQENDGVRRAEVTGVHTKRFERELSGDGSVFAVKFLPGAFSVSMNGPLSRLRERTVPVAAVFGEAGDEWAAKVFSEPSLEGRMQLCTRFLASRLAPLSSDAARVRDLALRMETDRTLLRASDAAATLGMDLRTLERAFRRWVGVTPKWVIQRYRLHEAAERLKSSLAVSLAGLAAELGYADQAHFARDFSRMIGQTPRAFAALHTTASTQAVSTHARSA